jgi:glycosyltransferase involved in cell wall biosynthesis
MKTTYGAERAIIELTKGFALHGYSNHVCSLYIAPECKVELSKHATLYQLGNGFGLDGFSATFLQYLLFPIAMMPILGKIKRNDTVIAHLYGTLLFCVLLKVIKRPKILYFCQEPPRFAYDLYDEWKQKLGNLKRLAFVLFVPLLRVIDLMAIQYMDEILANSMYSADLLARIYNRKSVSCYLGTKVNFFSSPAKVQEGYFKEFKRPLLLTVGKLHLRKNIRIQLDMVKEFVEKGKELTLVVVGDGPHKIELKDTIEKLQISKYVHFLGSITNRTKLAWCYQNCDMFIFTAKMEPFGLVVVEAMAAGKTVVVPSEGGPKEIVCDGINGLIYKQDDLDDLCRKVDRVLNNPQEKNLLELEAKKRAREFTWEKTFERVARIHEFVNQEQE